MALKYIKRDKDRHGNLRLYFRRKGFPTVRLPGNENSEEFIDAYAKCLADCETKLKTKSARSVQQQPTRPNFDQLISAYYRSTSFKAVVESTKKTYRSSLEWFRRHHGHRFLDDVSFAKLDAVISSRSETPSAANKLIKRLRQILKLAVKLGWIDHNPAKELEFYPTGEIHTWEIAEQQQFLRYWGPGTKARLAMLLHFYTGQRRSDIVEMKWNDINDDKISVVQFKTKSRLLIPIHPDLREELSLQDGRPLQGTIIKTEYGKSYTRDGYGNWFRKVCDRAVLPKRCSSHGLRKASAVALAHAGCSANEIMSITGHKSLSEVARYTREADQLTLSESAMARMAGHKWDNSTPRKMSHHNDNLTISDTYEGDGGPGGTRTPNLAVMSRQL